MAKGSNFGNVSVSKSVDPPQQPKNVASYGFPTTYRNDSFDTSTVQTSVNSFDVSTGFTSDTPQIISLIDFVPVYKDNGTLTKFGEFLQSKQDSKLISAKSSIDSILSLSDYKKIEKKIKDNKKIIREFFDSYGSEIESLLFEIESLKLKMDFRYPLDQKILEDAGYFQYYTFGKPAEIEQILGDTKEIYEKWTATKSWLQSCLKIKDILREGMPYTINDTNFIIDTNGYKNPHTLASTTSPSSKFNYNSLLSGVGKVLDVYGGDIYGLSLSPLLPKGDSQISQSPAFEPESPVSQEQLTPATLDFTSLSDIELATNSLVSLVQGQFSLFTNKPFSTTEPVENSIAKLSYLISKEFLYSKKLVEGSQNNNTKISEIFGNFNFSLNTEGSNINFWDHVVGLFGKDITDIQVSPLGGGNSLVSLCQSVEANNVEVLTFEDQYLKDDIGVRKGTTLTPGIFYYLESALNSNASGFDTARIQSLIARLGNSIDFCNLASDEMMFTDSYLPFKSTNERIAKIYSSNKKDPNVETVFDLLYGISDPPVNQYGLDNPISLIRKIENSILSDSRILNRETGPASPTNSDFSDFSGLMISAALSDPTLLCALFLMMRIDSLGQTSSKSAELLSDFVEDRIIKTFPQFQFSEFSELDVSKPKKIRIKYFFDPLNDSINANLHPFYLLKKISLLLQEAKTSLSTGAFLPNQSEGLLAYSGINSTAYLFSLFYLCCIIVHSANPDRISGINISEDGITFGCKRLYDPFAPAPVGPSALFQGLGNTGGTSEKELVIDNVLQNSENILFSYIKSSMSKFNTFKIFLTTLRTSLINFRTQLESGNFKKFLDKTKQYLGSSDDIRRLMTREQLKIVQATGRDLHERCREDYDSPIKDIYPYFDSLKDNTAVDSLIPIEDSSLVSWNLFLKNQLKQWKFRESDGFNVKIISVGIPQQFIRRLQVSASEVTQSSQKNKIIRIKIHRIDSLRPYLIHKPLEFLFDLNRFPAKNLENFDTPADVLNGKKQLSKLPFLRQNGAGKVEIYDPFASDFAFLSPYDRQALDNNHMFSYMIEEYFRFISDVSISETKFNEFNNAAGLTPNQFDNFMKATLGQVPETSLNPSCKKFFVKNSFLFNSTNLFLTKQITPRKFDRVFHIPFDPDDFTYTISGDNSGTVFNRSKTTKNDVTFDKYYVTFETFSLNIVSSNSIVI